MCWPAYGGGACRPIFYIIEYLESVCVAVLPSQPFGDRFLWRERASVYTCTVSPDYAVDGRCSNFRYSVFCACFGMVFYVLSGACMYDTFLSQVCLAWRRAIHVFLLRSVTTRSGPGLGFYMFMADGRHHLRYLIVSWKLIFA